MITTANRIFVNPDYAAQFEENFRNRAGLVDRMPGFVSNQLLRPVNPGDPYIVLTVWESRAQFEAWVRSDAFREGHARSGSLPKETFSAPSKLELHEIVLDTSRPDLRAEPPGGPFHPHG
jgi:heme-degrading monooxygenase HmoA